MTGPIHRYPPLSPGPLPELPPILLDGDPQSIPAGFENTIAAGNRIWLLPVDPGVIAILWECSATAFDRIAALTRDGCIWLVLSPADHRPVAPLQKAIWNREDSCLIEVPERGASWRAELGGWNSRGQWIALTTSPPLQLPPPPPPRPRLQPSPIQVTAPAEPVPFPPDPSPAQTGSHPETRPQTSPLEAFGRTQSHSPSDGSSAGIAIPPASPSNAASLALSALIQPWLPSTTDPAAPPSTGAGTSPTAQYRVLNADTFPSRHSETSPTPTSASPSSWS